jgi:hypothetical protein
MITTKTSTDRIINRAPKGGAISPVNNQFYLGGQFMPCVSIPAEAGPVKLTGSVRQVSWATRLRDQALANLNDEINVRLLFLAEAKTETEAKVYRQDVKPLLIARHSLMTERSAARVIERRGELV